MLTIVLAVKRRKDLSLHFLTVELPQAFDNYQVSIPLFKQPIQRIILLIFSVLGP